MATTVEIADPVATALTRVIEVFDRELTSDLPFVNELAERVRQYRGKLLRPRLLLLSGAAAGGIRRQHEVLGAVVEMVHMATLVHDDVLDEADVRRHAPTVNRLIGNEGAVLLGDYLISHSYHLCCSLDSTYAARRIAGTTNTVCEGELLQVANRGNLDLSEETYLQIIRRKTAALTRVCCDLGAWAAGAPSGVCHRLAAYGRSLGMAFQIADDLLDVTGSEREVGKTLGRDADLCKPTLPIIYCLAGDDGAARRRMHNMLTSPSPDRADMEALLNETGSMQRALDKAREFVASALESLDPLDESEAKRALIHAAEFVVTRRA